MFSFRAGALALLKCCQRHARRGGATHVNPTLDGQERSPEESGGADNKSDYEVDKNEFWRRQEGRLKADDVQERDEDEEDRDDKDDDKSFDLAVLFPVLPEDEEEYNHLSPTLGPMEHCVLSLCYYAMCRQSARAAEQFLDDLHSFLEPGSEADDGDRDREARLQAFQEQNLIAHHNYASARDKYYQSVRRLWDLTEVLQNRNQGDHIRFIWSHIIVLNRFTKGPSREDPLRYHRLDITATLLPSMGDNPERA
ncbi:hypothetical protein FA13DRAFT_1709884 [Coprinellus micaceus]|uniref:Uncharacterized protein n=1 Tax=Coprinellus micaceus TaxID=71717 RepID=A0A4Y7TBS5_COPMI|nr:hypothetical protein FA13DRAFT_1709884 [Coprinellus micaceus]